MLGELTLLIQSMLYLLKCMHMVRNEIGFERLFFEITHIIYHFNFLGYIIWNDFDVEKEN